MPEYVSLDALRATAERDVELNGRTYRIRRLSPLELMEMFGDIPALAEPGERGKVLARKPGMRDTVVLPLVRAIVAPKITEDELYLIPSEDINGLIAAVQELSGLARPFDGDNTAPA